MCGKYIVILVCEIGVQVLCTINENSTTMKFFRNIRQNLLAEHRIRKYLFYATGEIILVVLGILIALKLNSINTNKLNRQSERSYLSAINENLSEDIKELQQRLKKDTVHLDSYTLLMKAFTSDSIKLDEDTMRFIMHNSSIINYFNPQNTVFEEMKSSGKLDLIKSTELRFGIMEYYNNSNKVVTSQEINNDMILRYRESSIDKKLDMNSLIEAKLPGQWNTEIDSFDLSFFDKNYSDPEVQEFARYVSLMKGGVMINHNWKKKLLKEAEEIKVQIERYLSD